MKQILLTLICVLCAVSAVAQRKETPLQEAQRKDTYTLSGYVSDRESGERLIGAAVYDTISHQGTITNTAGFYTITLPAGRKCALTASYVGYSASQPFVTDSTQTHHFVLTNTTQLQEVTVTGHQSLSAPDNVQMSAIEVPVSQIMAIPALGGEVDVLKAIQLLPGVQAAGEGNAGLYVRGGGPDENLVILDGAPLYNINHAMGMFSVFNADAIKNVTLYKGNFPARFGSRLSSVIDVRQKEGNNSFWHGGISVGLISTKLNVEGPIFNKAELDSLQAGYSPRANTTFNISARRTYFDLFTAPLIATMTASYGNKINVLAGYYFYDINAKLSHTFSDKDRLTVGFYNGADVEYMNMKQREDANNHYALNMRYTWGNTLAAADWQHRINHQLFLHTRVHYSGYQCRLNEKMAMQSYEDTVNAYVDQHMGYTSMIHDAAVSTNLEYSPNQRHNVTAGVEYTYHHFRPSVQNQFFLSETDTAAAAFKLDTTLGGQILHGHEAAAYIEDTWTPCTWFRLNYGARFSLYGIDGKVYPSAEPRIGMRFLPHKDVGLKLSYSYMSQYVHLLSSSQVSLPSDLWVPVTKNIPPMRSMQVAAGVSYNLLNQVEMSVEGYYKRSLNLIEYKEGATFMGYTDDWQKQVEIGNGWSYGVEFLVQRKIGPVTGWIGYTWSRSMRQFDKINGGKPFHAKYDREHDLSITLQYQITDHIDVAGTWVYGTGSRGTLVTQTYYVTKGTYDQMPVEYYKERNGYKMPDYHRLDLAINFHFPHKLSEKGKKGKANGYYGHGGWLRNAEHILNISCYNVYCRMNPMFIEADVYSGKLYQISIFPILPSISYHFKF